MGRLNESARIRAGHYHKVRLCENISFSFSHLNENYYSHFLPIVNHTNQIIQNLTVGVSFCHLKILP